MELVKEPAQERRGLDYVVATFSASTPKKQQDQFDSLLELAEEIAPTWNFTDRGSSRHYERVFQNELGVRVELTEPGMLGQVSAGGMCFSLPGTCWWVQSDEQAALNVLRIAHIDGFKHFTRLDWQNTELHPSWDAYRIREAVTQGEVWVKGASTFRDYMDRDSDGTPTNGLTMYWGSTRSEKLGRSYDKAANAGWVTPAIRDEVQTRGRWAQAHGRELVADLEKAHGSAEMVEAIHQHTASALTQHLQYWTLNGTSPKKDNNWKRKAQPADWYAQRIGKPSKAVRKAAKPAVDLETTVDYGVQQYGRYFARWVDEMARKHDMEPNFAMGALLCRFKSRLKDEDMDWYLEGLNARQRKTALKELEELKNEIALSQERGWWVESEKSPY